VFQQRGVHLPEGGQGFAKSCRVTFLDDDNFILENKTFSWVLMAFNITRSLQTKRCSHANERQTNKQLSSDSKQQGKTTWLI
jgi:hypothetical protein